MNEIFCRSPIEWRSRIEIGSSAGGGMARHHSMWGIASSRPQRDSPSGMPMISPMITASVNPAPMRIRLGTTWRWNCEKSHISLNWTRIVDSRGNSGSLAWTVHACQAARISNGTAISAAIAATR